jgi:hypothetical protein
MHILWRYALCTGVINYAVTFALGVGISHLTGKGKQIIEASINIGLRKCVRWFCTEQPLLTYHNYHLYDTANYPEYLGKCHMINVPWVFTSMWFFIKGLLDE